MHEMPWQFLRDLHVACKMQREEKEKGRMQIKTVLSIFGPKKRPDDGMAIGMAVPILVTWIPCLAQMVPQGAPRSHFAAFW